MSSVKDTQKLCIPRHADKQIQGSLDLDGKLPLRYMVFALYVVFKTAIFFMLYRQSLLVKKTPGSSLTQASENEDSSDEHDAGYLKIIFYFYQVAELVIFNSPESTFHMVIIIFFTMFT